LPARYLVERVLELTWGERLADLDLFSAFPPV